MEKCSFVRLFFLCSWLVLICSSGVSFGSDDDTGEYVWDLPAGFPVPHVPDDNPMSEIKVRLGRYLFYDRRLSINGQYSCGSCHRQARAFTDGLTEALGATDEKHRRNSMSLTNVAYNVSLTWASPEISTLEDQIRIPLFNKAPIEMGLNENQAEVIELLESDPRYNSLFAKAFPNSKIVFSIDNLLKAIAAFTRTLISGDSVYDRLVYKDERSLMSPSAWRGMRLFYSELTGCAQCHQGFNFSGPVKYSLAPDAEPAFHNMAPYNVDGLGAYPEEDRGLLEVSRQKPDMGKFRAPSLRNIEYTAPYMHDGSIETLEAVIEHYAMGGRIDNPFKDPLLGGFDISAGDKQDLLSFLKSLSDKSFITNPLFSNPFETRDVANVDQ